MTHRKSGKNLRSSAQLHSEQSAYTLLITMTDEVQQASKKRSKKAEVSEVEAAVDTPKKPKKKSKKAADISEDTMKKDKKRSRAPAEEDSLAPVKKAKKVQQRLTSNVKLLLQVYQSYMHLQPSF